eukprot:Hpha_TRINITY_DN20930_c0_g1::TRINITY_DN20930_c0_g1_i1::g.139656::m.139656
MSDDGYTTPGDDEHSTPRHETPKAAVERAAPPRSASPPSLMSKGLSTRKQPGTASPPRRSSTVVSFVQEEPRPVGRSTSTASGFSRSGSRSKFQGLKLEGVVSAVPDREEPNPDTSSPQVSSIRDDSRDAPGVGGLVQRSSSDIMNLSSMADVPDASPAPVTSAGRTTHTAAGSAPAKKEEGGAAAAAASPTLTSILVRDRLGSAPRRSAEIIDPPAPAP